MTLHNFVQLFRDQPFTRYLANSLFLTGAQVLVQVCCASLGGFAGTLLSIVPVTVLLLILQKEFISGLTSGAVEG